MIKCDGCENVLEGITEREFLYDMLTKVRMRHGEEHRDLLKPDIELKGWGVHYFEITKNTVMVCPICSERIVTTEDDAFLLERLRKREDFKKLGKGALARVLTNAVGFVGSADNYMDDNKLISAHKMLVGAISVVEAVVHALEKPDEGD